MPKPGRDHYIKLVERDYFGNVMAENLDAVVACFTPDAEITIFHGDNPIRRFFGQPTGDQQHLRTFWAHLCGNYDSHFGRFRHVVDADNECCASTFIVTLKPKPTSEYLATGTLTLNNCNFFWCRAGQIHRMTIYYANPTLGAKLGLAASGPTGFPKG
ncbi:MAG: nuclear transport factor 2 family protein [Rhodospirillaceae bacterium]|nr:nuclear transport factor 2 family protein [Rhodospirillaceae bacterium]